MIVRLKWFFLSILIIYYLYIPELPNTALMSIEYNFIKDIMYFMVPMIPAFFRITVLLLILFSVNLLIQTTTKEEILAALLWLLMPLKVFSINIERLSLRAVLTLEYVEILADYLTNYKKNLKKSVMDEAFVSNTHLSYSWMDVYLRKKYILSRLVKDSGTILYEILAKAKRQSGKSYTIDCVVRPKLNQLIFPMVLFLLFFLSL
jgi:hypothetical protein